ncbi:MAG: OmpA family protein [Proteobacteria bacterium]|nr:OmpA family protein [Pseudomonadota bacterium]
MAQEASLDAQRFTPVGSYRGFIVTHDGRILPKRKFGFDIVLSGAVRPLEKTDTDLQRQVGIIDFLFAGHARAGFSITDWVEVDLTMAFMQFTAVGDGLTEVGGGTGLNTVFSLGDLWLEGRFQPLKQDQHFVDMGVIPFVTFPTGNPNIFLTSGLPTFGVKLAVGHRFERVRLGGHFGYRFKPSYAQVGGNVAADDELLYSLGVALTPLKDKIDIQLELNGVGIVGPGLAQLPSDVGRSVAHSPLELLVSGRFRVHPKIDVVAGVGPGITAGVGTPAVRFFGGIAWAPSADSDGDGILDSDDACPDDPEDFDDFEDADGCPELDNDADGIPDTDDACPNDAEDMDGFEDGDGCPELDNDKDGIPDSRDTCPNDAEDMDGFEDEDGCPELDNDKDGIADTDDSCPNNPEDKDGFEDEDGCPDPDNDEDGIADVDDLCPDQPENFNDHKDDDGCPDDVIAVVTGEKIVILQKILFVFGKDRILRRSYPVLDAVEQTLRDNPGITKIRIEGHTDDKGSDSSNQKLSENRAAAIMRHLVKAGIGPERLVAVGYGEARPIDTNKTEEGRERNRRVEFTILDQEQEVEMRGVDTEQ